MKPKASSDEDRSKGRKRTGRSKPKPEVRKKRGKGGAGASGKTRGATRPKKVWKGPLDPWAVNDVTLSAMRHYIRNCGLSQAELARRWHVSRQWVSKLLNEVKVCTLDMLYRFSNGVQSDSTDLLVQVENGLPRMLPAPGSTKSAKKCPS